MSSALNRWLLTGFSGGVALFAAAPAHAEQFVVAQATYTHSAQTTKDSHFFVKPSAVTPANWMSPVDYAGGSVHVRLEVKTKPSATPTRYQICFEMKQNYCCTDQAPAYTAAGVYEWDTDIEKMWRPGPVDFATGIRQSALILKDTNNVKPAPENVGEETSKLYLPSDLDVTVTVVSAGAEFMPPDDPDPPLGGSGGGGAGGMVGGSGGGAGGAPAAAGTGGGGTASVPEPTGGMAPVIPITPTGGTGSGGATAPVGFTSAGDDGSCSIGGVTRTSGSALLGVGLIVAMLGLRRRRR